MPGKRRNLSIPCCELGIHIPVVYLRVTDSGLGLGSYINASYPRSKNTHVSLSPRKSLLRQVFLISRSVWNTLKVRISLKSGRSPGCCVPSPGASSSWLSFKGLGEPGRLLTWTYPRFGPVEKAAGNAAVFLHTVQFGNDALQCRKTSGCFLAPQAGRGNRRMPPKSSVASPVFIHGTW